VPTSAYSGTPLSKKLGIKSGVRVLLFEAPAEFREWLGELPDDVAFTSRMAENVDIVHVFAVRSAKLAHHLQRLRKELRQDAAVWVSWPKKASKVPTDITEDVIRKIALPLGFVDIKVCAVTDVWSGLKLVIRKSERASAGRPQ
jgi:hypothetical protein